MISDDPAVVDAPPPQKKIGKKLSRDKVSKAIALVQARINASKKSGSQQQQQQQQQQQKATKLTVSTSSQGNSSSHNNDSGCDVSNSKGRDYTHHHSPIRTPLQKVQSPTSPSTMGGKDMEQQQKSIFNFTSFSSCGTGTTTTISNPCEYAATNQENEPTPRARSSVVPRSVEGRNHDGTNSQSNESVYDFSQESEQEMEAIAKISRSIRTVRTPKQAREETETSQRRKSTTSYSYSKALDDEQREAPESSNQWSLDEELKQRPSNPVKEEDTDQDNDDEETITTFVPNEKNSFDNSETEKSGFDALFDIAMRDGSFEKLPGYHVAYETKSKTKSKPTKQSKKATSTNRKTANASEPRPDAGGSCFYQSQTQDPPDSHMLPHLMGSRDELQEKHSSCDSHDSPRNIYSGSPNVLSKVSDFIDKVEHNEKPSRPAADEFDPESFFEALEANDFDASTLESIFAPSPRSASKMKNRFNTKDVRKALKAAEATTVSPTPHAELDAREPIQSRSRESLKDLPSLSLSKSGQSEEKDPICQIRDDILNETSSLIKYTTGTRQKQKQKPQRRQEDPPEGLCEEDTSLHRKADPPAEHAHSREEANNDNNKNAADVVDRTKEQNDTTPQRSGTVRSGAPRPERSVDNSGPFVFDLTHIASEEVMNEEKPSGESGLSNDVAKEESNPDSALLKQQSMDANESADKYPKDRTNDAPNADSTESAGCSTKLEISIDSSTNAFASSVGGAAFEQLVTAMSEAAAQCKNVGGHSTQEISEPDVHATVQEIQGHTNKPDKKEKAELVGSEKTDDGGQDCGDDDDDGLESARLSTVQLTLDEVKRLVNEGDDEALSRDEMELLEQLERTFSIPSLLTDLAEPNLEQLAPASTSSDDLSSQLSKKLILKLINKQRQSHDENTSGFAEEHLFNASSSSTGDLDCDNKESDKQRSDAVAINERKEDSQQQISSSIEPIYTFQPAAQEKGNSTTSSYYSTVETNEFIPGRFEEVKEGELENFMSLESVGSSKKRKSLEEVGEVGSHSRNNTHWLSTANIFACRAAAQDSDTGCDLTEKTILDNNNGSAGMHLDTSHHAANPLYCENVQKNNNIPFNQQHLHSSSEAISDVRNDTIDFVYSDATAPECSPPKSKTDYQKLANSSHESEIFGKLDPKPLRLLRKEGHGDEVEKESLILAISSSSSEEEDEYEAETDPDAFVPYQDDERKESLTANRECQENIMGVSRSQQVPFDSSLHTVQQLTEIIATKREDFADFFLDESDSKQTAKQRIASRNSVEGRRDTENSTILLQESQVNLNHPLAAMGSSPENKSAGHKEENPSIGHHINCAFQENSANSSQSKDGPRCGQSEPGGEVSKGPEDISIEVRLVAEDAEEDAEETVDLAELEQYWMEESKQHRFENQFEHGVATPADDHDLYVTKIAKSIDQTPRMHQSKHFDFIEEVDESENASAYISRMTSLKKGGHLPNLNTEALGSFADAKGHEDDTDAIEVDLDVGFVQKSLAPIFSDELQTWDEEDSHNSSDKAQDRYAPSFESGQSGHSTHFVAPTNGNNGEMSNSGTSSVDEQNSSRNSLNPLKPLGSRTSSSFVDQDDESLADYSTNQGPGTLLSSDSDHASVQSKEDESSSRGEKVDKFPPPRDLRNFESDSYESVNDEYTRKRELASRKHSWITRTTSSISHKLSFATVEIPKAINGVEAARRLSKRSIKHPVSYRRSNVPATTVWKLSYKERCRPHPGYMDVDYYSLCDSSDVSERRPHLFDVAPWETRDVRQHFLHDQSISLSKNWFGKLLKARGNQLIREPVAHPRSMEMPMDHINPEDWTDEWYKTWKPPNRNNPNISDSGSDSGSVVSRARSRTSQSVPDDSSSYNSRTSADGSFCGNATHSGGSEDIFSDIDDESLEDDDAPQCGELINVKPKIGERVTRIHPDFTCELRNSRWRKKYFPKGSFPYK